MNCYKQNGQKEEMGIKRKAGTDSNEHLVDYSESLDFIPGNGKL